MLVSLGKKKYEAMWLHFAPCGRYRMGPDELVVREPITVDVGGHTCNRSAVLCVLLRMNKGKAKVQGSMLGISIIHPKDCCCFNPEVGRRLSFDRALRYGKLSKRDREKAWSAFFGLNRVARATLPTVAVAHGTIGGRAV